MLPGWCESVGVQAEIRIARELGKPVRYLAPELASVSLTLAPVASGCPEANQTPTGAARPRWPGSRRRCRDESDQREETPPGGLVGDGVVGAGYASASGWFGS